MNNYIVKIVQKEWGCRTSKYFLLGGSPFGMPDFKLFCFQPLKSMLSLMKKDDSPFFRSESCNEAY